MITPLIDDFLPVLKFAPYWFVTSKIIKKLHNALFADYDILYFDEDSSNITFSGDENSKYAVFSGPYFPVFGLNMEI